MPPAELSNLLSIGESENPVFLVDSPNVQYTPDTITASYAYRTCRVTADSTTGTLKAVPQETKYEFKTDRRVPTIGLLLVGWGGNNGSTLTASILANKHKLQWNTKNGVQTPNYYGSLLLASTVKLGTDASNRDIHIPFNQLLPMVHPNDLVIGGWDINSGNLAEAMRRAKVLDWDLQRQVRKEMEGMKPLPSIYYPDFIAANQSERADNLIAGTKWEQLERIRNDIREFKNKNRLNKVIVVWTANTERYSAVLPGVNDTEENLLKAIREGHEEISPSTMFAVASILEGAPFVNGSPQNTFIPGAVQLAESHKVYVGGDDFKSGQTKLKSVLADFLVNAGIKPLAITSYNHLGNNDGRNLSAPQQFKSKEISKSSVVDDMVAANHILYQKGEHPDHTIVIKYVPSVGDTKRALDEYESEIFMGGRSTISIFNMCEDSLLAAPLIIDLVLLTELMTRIQYRVEGKDFQPFHSVLSILSYMLKAPLVPEGQLVVNSLGKQRMALENILRACVGLEPQNEMLLEQRVWH